MYSQPSFPGKSRAVTILRIGLLVFLEHDAAAPPTMS